jgi:DNA-binding MarR family transcriptional regulator
VTTASRSDSLRHLEREVGMLIRRVRRVIGERARLVHEELQPASYLMLSWLVDQGPVRASSMAEQFTIDKGAVSRQLQHLDALGLVERTPDPADGRATLVAASDDAVRRLADVAEHRRKWLD